MDILSRLFGRKAATLSADDIAQEINGASADLAKARERVASTRTALGEIAVMTDAEHASVEAANAEAHRSVVRLEAKIQALQEVHARTLKVEADAALKARAKAAQRMLDQVVPKLLDQYDLEIAPKLSDIVEQLKTCRVEIDAVNEELRRNPVADPIPNIDVMYRKEPDHVTPERRETRTVWTEFNRETGCWQDNPILIRVNGEMVPARAGCRRETREVVVSPEHRRRGRYLESLESILLPPGRIGRKRHWPRES